MVAVIFEALSEVVQQRHGTQCSDRGIELSPVRNGGVALDGFSVRSKGYVRMDAEVEEKWLEKLEEGRCSK
jgi:hypothetical protein